MFEVLKLQGGITALYKRRPGAFEVLFFKKNQGFLGRAEVQQIGSCDLQEVLATVCPRTEQAQESAESRGNSRGSQRPALEGMACSGTTQLIKA